MKAGWELKALGDVCEIAPKKALVKKTLTDEQLVSFVPMDHLGELESHFTAKEDRQLSSVYKGYTYFCDNDVIIAKITPCFENGKMGVVSGMTNGVGFGSSEFVPIRGQGKTLPKYLFYYLLRNDFRENGARVMSGAVGHKRVPKEYIENLPIPLPPLEEQKRIVSILDEAFEGLDRARENAEANLKSARELFESSLGAVFDHASDGWTKGTVGSMIHDGILERPLDGNHGETHPKKSEFQSSGVPFIMASDLVNGSVDQNNCYFISKSQAETLRKGFAKDGDVLISHKGTIGRSAVLRTDLDYVMLTPQVTYYRVADQNRLLPEFLYFYFHSATFVRVMKDLASAGSTRAYIGITKQHELPLLLPEITLQLELIDRFKSLEVIRNKAILSYETKLQDISDLRQSLLQRAFAGELT